MLLNLILWVLFGGLAGWIASLIMRTDAEQGAVGNVIIGVIGAIIGGWLARMFMGADVTGFNLTSLVIAVVGAVVLLAVLRAFGVMGGRGVDHRI